MPGFSTLQRKFVRAVFSIVIAVVAGACAAPEPAGLGRGGGGSALPSSAPRGHTSTRAESSAERSSPSPVAAAAGGGGVTQRNDADTPPNRAAGAAALDGTTSEGAAVEQVESPEGPAIDSKPALPRFERFELVADGVSIADNIGRPGNGWGVHQTRVLRLENGDVYTAYLTTGPTLDTSQWHLVRRGDAGWQAVASGLAGREPVNILRIADAGIALVAWPNHSPVLTTFAISNGRSLRSDTPIPGRWETETFVWPYNAAGVGSDGTICVLQSNSSLKPGFLLWACRSASDGSWEFRQTSLPYRYCYAIMFPKKTQLTLVAVRDVTWSALGYAKPAGAIDYSFTEVRAFATPDYRSTPLASSLVREELPTAAYPAPNVHHVDAYMDSKGRLHVIYMLVGQGTLGMKQTRHAMLVDDKVVADVELPMDGFWRITQDTTGGFWALYGSGSRFVVYRGISEDGLTLGAPTELDIGGEQVRYAGMAIAAPRTGVPLDDVVDGVFPSGRLGERWVYFRVRLR
jgi:hypothetical protein